jgi:hypothetical protein
VLGLLMILFRLFGQQSHSDFMQIFEVGWIYTFRLSLSLGFPFCQCFWKRTMCLSQQWKSNFGISKQIFCLRFLEGFIAGRLFCPGHNAEMPPLFGETSKRSGWCVC